MADQKIRKRWRVGVQKFDNRGVKYTVAGGERYELIEI